MQTKIYLPSPRKLTFYFFFITHMLEEGSPSVQNSFILHPIVIKKKKRMLRLLLERATWSSPAPGQVHLQAGAHGNQTGTLPPLVPLLHAALLLCCPKLRRLHIASVLTLPGHPHPQRTGERKEPQSCSLAVGHSSLWGLQKKKSPRNKKGWNAPKNNKPRNEVWCVWSARDDRLWKSSFSA